LYGGELIKIAGNKTFNILTIIAQASKNISSYSSPSILNGHAFSC